MKRLFPIVVLVVFGGVAKMSPISAPTKLISMKKNYLENLFFMSDEEEKTLEGNAVDNPVIEKVKARILKSLHLKEPPKVHQVLPSLQNFILQNNSWSGLSKSKNVSKTSKDGRSEFLLSDIVPNTCFDRRDTKCVRFQISLKELKEGPMSAEIWLFKRENIRHFNMTLLKEEANRAALSTETFQIINQSKSARWIRLDATELLRRVSSDVLDLEVSSDTSRDFPIETGKHKNPIVIVKDTSVKSRIKRSTGECEKGMTSCCVKNFHISFSEIGWDNWIVTPAGYNANICRGSCENRMDLANHHYSTVMILMLSKSKRNTSEISDSIHCTPKKYKPLSIIYIDEAGLQIIRQIPNMTVTECYCS